MSLSFQNVLDFDRSDECNDFTIMSGVFFFVAPFLVGK